MPRGGRRKGAGRPFGSKDTVPKRRPPGGTKQDEYIGRLKGMLEDARLAEYFYTNAERTFNGSLLELCQCLAKAENLPVTIRLAAARVGIAYEPPPVPWTPHDMSDEQLKTAIEACRPLLDEYNAERDDQLRKLIEAGAVSEEQALKVRAIFVEAGAPAWVPLR